MTPAWKSWALPDGPTNVNAWQDDRCAMCGTERRPCPTCGQQRGKGLVEDHCHRTGLRRGYLCRSCNVLEASSAGDAWIGWRAGDNPCAALGEFEVYTGSFGWDPMGLRQDAALYYYTDDERDAWWAQIVSDLRAGGDWPTDAPWTPQARARRDRDMASLNAAVSAIPAGLR